MPVPTVPDANAATGSLFAAWAEKDLEERNPEEERPASGTSGKPIDVDLLAESAFSQFDDQKDLYNKIQSGQKQTNRFKPY